MTAILNEILKTWWFTRSIPALVSTSRSPDAWCFLQNTGMPLGSLNSPFVVLITKTYQHKNILPGNCPCTITFLSWDICCLLQCCQPSLVMLVSGQKQSTRFLNCCFIMFYFVRGFFLLNGCFSSPCSPSVTVRWANVFEERIQKHTYGRQNKRVTKGEPFI